MRYMVGAEQLQQVPSLAHRPDGVFRVARTAPVGPTHAVCAVTGVTVCGIKANALEVLNEDWEAACFVEKCADCSPPFSAAGAGSRAALPPGRAPAKSRFVLICPVPIWWPGATRPRWSRREPTPATGTCGHWWRAATLPRPYQTGQLELPGRRGGSTPSCHDRRPRLGRHGRRLRLSGTLRGPRRSRSLLRRGDATNTATRGRAGDRSHGPDRLRLGAG